MGSVNSLTSNIRSKKKKTSNIFSKIFQKEEHDDIDFCSIFFKKKYYIFLLERNQS